MTKFEQYQELRGWDIARHDENRRQLKAGEVDRVAFDILEQARAATYRAEFERIMPALTITR